ncbi:MAG: ABC transporter substrate-binding protein [Burkholderiaceae bacterium]
MSIDRRRFLRTTAAGTLAANPFLRSAHAAGEPGTVRWLMAENTTGNWDPSANTTLANINCEYLVYDYLMIYPLAPNSDPTKPELRLAEAYEILDPYSVRIRVRKGVRFHDGGELTAEDVKASFEHYSRPKVARSFYAAPIRSTVEDKYTLVINSKEAMMTIDTFLFLQFYSPILRAKDVANPKVLQTGMNGTGPYKYAGLQGNGFAFEAHAEHWGKKPAVKKVIVRHVPDGNARVLALLSGEAEFIERLEPEQYQTLESKPGIAVSKVKSTENKYLHFRCNRKPFDDWRVRRAAAAAIDRDAVLGIVSDAGYAADCLLPPQKVGYMPLPDYGKFDPALCQKLLAEAGYPNGKGLPELEYITSTGFYPKTKEYCEAITEMLQAQGFPVKLTVMEVAAWNDRYYNPNAGHMIDGGWAVATPEPDPQIVLQYQSKIALITGVKDPEIDAAIAKEVVAPTLDLRRAVLQQEVLPVIAKKMPNLVLFNSNMLHAMSSRLTGVLITPSGQVDFAKVSVG